MTLASVEQLTSEEHYEHLATETRLPLLFGSRELQGRIFAIGYSSANNIGTWTIGVAWCVGPVADISNVLLDDEAPPSGVLINSYTGSQYQGVDSLLLAAIPNYGDTMVAQLGTRYLGIAYSVIEFEDPTHFTSLPRITARVSAGYSNPVDAIEQLITDTHIGLGAKINKDSFELSRNYCAELVNGLQLRRSIGLIVDQSKSIREWIDVLSNYAGCYVFRRVDTWYCVPDAPVTQVHRLLDTEIFRTGMTYFSPDWSSVPNVITVAYTDTDDDGVVTIQTATVHDPGHEVELRQSLAMHGITNYGQAYREGLERIAQLRESEVTLKSGYHLLRFEPGDIIQYTTHYREETEVNTRDYVVRVEQVSLANDTVTIRAREYTSARHSTETPDRPSFTKGSTLIGG